VARQYKRYEFHRWLLGRGGDMVWSALVIVTVLLPLASLTIDVPRYFTLRSRLQLAADATAEAMARCVDTVHFQNVGETRLHRECVEADAGTIFGQATQDLAAKGYSPNLGAVAVDEAADRVTVDASGTTVLFFGLTPQFSVDVRAVSSFRMEER
jgi:hypothetical protein